MLRSLYLFETLNIRICHLEILSLNAVYNIVFKNGDNIVEERSKLMLKKMLALSVIMLVLILTGCDKRPATPAPPEQTITDVRIYFPVGQDFTWVYEGNGNEYAAFTHKVIHKQESKVQLAKDNGGTRLGMVLEVLPEAVKIHYAEEEAYTDAKLFNAAPNRSDIWLKAPLQAGAAWENGRERREVLSVNETVQVPAGTYSNVVKIRITSLAAADSGDRLEYYAPQVGLVLSRFSANGTVIESRLKTFKQTD